MGKKLEKVAEKGEGVMCERLINFTVTSLHNHPVNVIHNADREKNQLVWQEQLSFLLWLIRWLSNKEYSQVPEGIMALGLYRFDKNIYTVLAF